VRAEQTGFLHCLLRYSDGSRLHIDLWAHSDDDGISWRRYSFHFGGPDNLLRFRFDGAPHHHELPFFPHHLHLGIHELRGVPQPSIRQIAELIRQHQSS
jgi:hypothetical protein